MICLDPIGGCEWRNCKKKCYYMDVFVPYIPLLLSGSVLVLLRLVADRLISKYIPLLLSACILVRITVAGDPLINLGTFVPS